MQIFINKNILWQRVAQFGTCYLNQYLLMFIWNLWPYTKLSCQYSLYGNGQWTISPMSLVRLPCCIYHFLSFSLFSLTQYGFSKLKNPSLWDAHRTDGLTVLLLSLLLFSIPFLVPSDCFWDRQCSTEGWWEVHLVLKFWETGIL